MKESSGFSLRTFFINRDLFFSRLLIFNLINRTTFDSRGFSILKLANTIFFDLNSTILALI